MNDYVKKFGPVIGALGAGFVGGELIHGVLAVALAVGAGIVVAKSGGNFLNAVKEVLGKN